MFTKYCLRHHALTSSSHVPLTAIIWGEHEYYIYIGHEETETDSGLGICPRLYAGKWQGRASKIGRLAPRCWNSRWSVRVRLPAVPAVVSSAPWFPGGRGGAGWVQWCSSTHLPQTGHAFSSLNAIYLWHSDLFASRSYLTFIFKDFLITQSCVYGGCIDGQFASVPQHLVLQIPRVSHTFAASIWPRILACH